MRIRFCTTSSEQHSKGHPAICRISAIYYSDSSVRTVLSHDVTSRTVSQYNLNYLASFVTKEENLGCKSIRNLSSPILKLQLNRLNFYQYFFLSFSLRVKILLRISVKIITGHEHNSLQILDTISDVLY